MIRAVMIRSVAAVLVLALCSGASSGETPTIDDAHVAEALELAADNRAELEKVLTHFTEVGDAQQLTAARFLVANMPGKGYVVTRLRDADGNTIEFDPLAYETYEESRDTIEALEKEHGELEWGRDRLVKDVETIEGDFLIRHIEEAFAAWRGVAADRRVGFDAFLNFVLPYRGSQEPLGNWISPLRERYGAAPEEVGADAPLRDLYKFISKDVHKRVRFNKRYYLHPTDQGFGEMETSGQGRCEDITNAITFAARSLALATAADYTPAWAHGSNNHAWNVLLDADGRGCAKGNAHAAKIYRKTFALQRGNLGFQLPEGREAPNRFLSSKSYIDVTTQYAETTDVTVAVDADAAGSDVAQGERFAYLCVFNGGEWVAIHWGPLADGKVTFTAMGRNIVYLPCVHDGEKLVPVGDPLLALKDGTVTRLPGTGATTGLLATALRPKRKSPDTNVVAPRSYLKSGTTYVLKRWNGEWSDVKEVAAEDEPLAFEGLADDGLYWLVAKESRRLERVFTVKDGRQRFW